MIFYWEHGKMFYVKYSTQKFNLLKRRLLKNLCECVIVL